MDRTRDVSFVPYTIVTCIYKDHALIVERLSAGDINFRCSIDLVPFISRAEDRVGSDQVLPFQSRDIDETGTNQFLDGLRPEAGKMNFIVGG